MKATDFTKEQQALMKRGGVVYDKNDGFDYCIHKSRIFRTEHDNEQTMWEEVEDMKAIKRNWMYDFDYTDTIQGEALFFAVGEWFDGSLVYSMLDDNGNVMPEHDGSFKQIRHNGRLVMVRI